MIDGSAVEMLEVVRGCSELSNGLSIFVSMFGELPFCASTQVFELLFLSFVLHLNFLGRRCSSGVGRTAWILGETNDPVKLTVQEFRPCGGPVPTIPQEKVFPSAELTS